MWACLILAAARAEYAVQVTSYPVLPALSFADGTSRWSFAYNPAYIPGGAGAGGLMVRVQNDTAAAPLQCADNRSPTTSSYLAATKLYPSGIPQPLAGADAVVLEPAGTAWERTTEDPRIVFDESSGLYWMTYTANGDGRPPNNRHQGIAIAKDPYSAAGWTKVCNQTRPCMPAAGLKSGAMLLRETPPHFMFMYDLRDGIRQVVVAKTDDSGALSRWSLTNQTLVAKRSAMWDAGLIEPGPPPLTLDDGNYLFLYNSATLHNDREYHVGFVVLSKEDPTIVLQRSSEPVLSWNSRSWQAGNDTAQLCNVKEVIFCAAARSLGNDTYQLYFGGADAVVGTATIQVTRSPPHATPSPPPAPLPPLPSLPRAAMPVAASCASDTDCSLNGVCTDNKLCSCDPGWTGDACAELVIGIAPSTGGVYGSAGGPFAVTSWGGNSVWDNATQLWHLYVTEILGDRCGLHNWMGHSTVTHATAKTLLGPYSKQSTAIPQQAHNPQAIRIDEKWYIFHIGSGSGGGAPPLPCNESLPSAAYSAFVAAGNGNGAAPVPTAPATGTATNPRDAAAGSGSTVAAAHCPAGTAGYTKHDGACIAGSACSKAHCSCAENVGSGDCTSGNVVECITNATAFCDANVHCRSVAVRTNGCAAGSTLMHWQAFRFGGNNAAVPNSDWTAYTKSGPPAPPAPSPPPPPPPPPRPATGSTVHVADSPYGPWLPLRSPVPKCNNPSPAVHPNGTVFLACTWMLYSAPSVDGPWSGGISIRPPHGGWEDPFLFFDRRGGFHIVAHVYKGGAGAGANNSISGHAFSRDGQSWTFSNVQPYSNVVRQEGSGGGTQVHTYATLERPKLMFSDQTDPHRPTAIFNGASPWWDETVPANDACAKCLNGGCVMCKVTCVQRGAMYNLDWTYTLGRPIEATGTAVGNTIAHD